MNIKEILEEAVTNLKENKIEEANLKAKILLAFTLKVSKEYLIINNDKEISQEHISEFNNYLNEIKQGKPLQYITGKQEFMGIEFNVNENVLIPQPDTEILVEKTIEIIQKSNNAKVLDLCTGSGAIAISIAESCLNAEVLASDISKEALEVAKSNDINKRVKFIQSDLFKSITEKFDVIVSNPPYIKTKEIELLSKEVQNEPQLALDGGEDGLDFYKKIIDQVPEFLKENGYLCLEIGEDQKEEVVALLENNGKYNNIKVYKDLGDNYRVIICTLKEKVI